MHMHNERLCSTLLSMKPRAFWVRYAIFSGLKSNLAGGFRSNSMYTRFLPPSAVFTACHRA